jgi:TRAP-type C4-dicarboxylate transport system permease small subunit
MTALAKFSEYLNRILLWIAGLFLVAMIVMTCANIVLRVVWLPVRGTFELMGYFGAIVTAFALGYTQIKKGHIAVDILVLKFSPRAQIILKAINSLICTAFFSLVAWQVAKYATTLRRTGEVTETLQIIYYPFTYGVSFGCIVLALVLFTETLKALTGEKEGGE